VRILISLFFIFMLQISFADNFSESIVLTNDTQKIDQFTLSYLYDEDSQLTINDVSQTDFKQIIPNQFGLGYRDGAAWFKLTIDNKSQFTAFVLFFSESFWKRFDLYEYKNNRWVKTENGLSVPLDKRSVREVSPAFSLYIPVNQTKTYYLHGQTMASHIGELILFTKQEFFRLDRFKITTLYTLYFGVLTIIFLLNTFLFVAMRERLYAYYIAYVISFIAFVGMQSGLYLIPGFSGWNEGLHTIGTLVVLFMMLFSGVYLELEKRLPKIDLLFRIFAGIFVLCGITIALDTPFSSLSFNILSSMFFALLLFVVIKEFFKGDIKARYYLLAIMLYMPTMGLMTLTFNGFIDNTDVSRYSFILGSFVEIVFFSMLLVNRFHALSNEKLSVQKELINEKNRSEKELSNKVNERTSELRAANILLSEQTRELEETKLKLEEESITDPLSQLYNRRYFTDASIRAFNNAQRYKQNLSIMMLDIDKFKNINDMYGHIVGDEVIVSCANTLKSMARKSDVVARYGGEEFILLLTQTAIEDVTSLAERIREDIVQQVLRGEKNEAISYSISIGISQILEKDNSIEQVIRRADKALFEAKDNGRNQVVTHKI